MNSAQTFRELTDTIPPQDPHGDGTGLRFETGEHGGDYPDNMPQAITMTDAQGRWAVYVPLRIERETSYTTSRRDGMYSTSMLMPSPLRGFAV
jgi:hypothetical protein